MKTVTRSARLKRLPIPPLRGNLHLAGGPQDDDTKNVEVVLMGDPAGLRSLADVLNALADLDQNKIEDLPKTDAREHVHLEPGQHLGKNSARLVVSRLDDRVGELPHFYGKRLRNSRPIREARRIENG